MNELAGNFTPEEEDLGLKQGAVDEAVTKHARTVARNVLSGRMIKTCRISSTLRRPFRRFQASELSRPGRAGQA